MANILKNGTNEWKSLAWIKLQYISFIDILAEQMLVGFSQAEYFGRPLLCNNGNKTGSLLENRLLT